MHSRGRNTVWSLLRASSDDERRIRQRLGVGTALTVLMSSLLAVVGLEKVVLTCALIVVVAAGTRLAVCALRQSGPRLRTSSRRAGVALRAGVNDAAGATRSGTARVVHILICARDSAGPAARRATGRCRETGTTVRRHILISVAPKLAGMGKVAVTSVSQQAQQLKHPARSQSVTEISVDRQARRLNAAGTKHRRNGAYARSVELHGRAIELLRELGDRRAVALTQNNLALALSHVGDHDGAIPLFEQAAATLHELGGEQEEGLIMANLAAAHRRRGEADASAVVLRHALTKLRQGSGAYEVVEAELRRAG
jgi:tetratricopeptide (TPR) repeat protein